MARKLRKGPCIDCGVHVERRRASMTPHRCHECSKAAAEAAADQMHNRCGPAWEKYLAARKLGATDERSATVIARRHT